MLVFFSNELGGFRFPFENRTLLAVTLVLELKNKNYLITMSAAKGTLLDIVGLQLPRLKRELPFWDRLNLRLLIHGIH